MKLASFDKEDSAWNMFYVGMAGKGCILETDFGIC